MTGIAEMFAELSWRRYDYQAALEIRASRLAVKQREWAETYRKKMRLDPTWREDRRAYMRDYMRDYDGRRRHDDPAYLERRRKHAREAMRRYYQRKQGRPVALLPRGGQAPGTPHRTHRCTLCDQPGHNRRRCPEAIS